MCNIEGECRAPTQCNRVTDTHCVFGSCNIGTCEGTLPSRWCTCGLDECAAVDSPGCVESLVSLAADAPPMKSMNWVQGQHGITRYMFVASLLFVSFSAMAS